MPSSGQERKMTQMKLLGLAAATALTLIAAIGAASAPAAVLCKTNASPCPEHYAIGTTIDAKLKVGTTSRITSSFGTVTCKKSAFSGRQTLTTAHGEISAFTFTECTDPFGSACTVKAVNLSWTYAGVATGGGNGTLTVTGQTGGHPGFTVECGSFMSCIFTMSSFTFGFVGGAPAILIVNGASLTPSGPNCPAQAFWDAEYEMTAPSSARLV
jgi:hypothetical protein